LNASSASPDSIDQRPVRVLVVDDSAFMRFTISQHLNQSRRIQVVGTAHNGLEALELIPRLQPDVITLDVEMPHLDGLSTLRRIMAENPLPVVMLSSLTGEGALETVQALTLGAVDFIPKPSNKANISTIMEDVVAKILRAANARVSPLVSRVRPAPPPAVTQSKRTRRLMGGERVVVIGSSTGGPRALCSVIPEIPADIPAAILVVQHMPVGFTRSLAERLDSLSAIQVKEAEPGDIPQVGQVLLAPGGFHMVLDGFGQVNLNQNQPVHGVRPSVDVTLASVVKQYGPASMAVILTGMGSDGTNGSALVHGAGGLVVAEAESTCVVYGMPRSVVEAGVADKVISLPQIASFINQAVRTPPERPPQRPLERPHRPEGI
jgi:two-component system chemotaxis response regulator CheB